MPSTFESPKLQNTSKPFIGLAQKLERVVPSLEWDLERAGIRIKRDRYGARGWYFRY